MNEIIVTEEHSRAVSLHRKIKANVQCAKETFLELGKSLKEMRDGKLYKELGYQNFEEYCEAEAEIGRAHGYRMIQIVENLPDDFVTSMLQIGTTKLSLLAMLDPADREELQQTVNVEEASVRELKAEIDTLKKEKKQLEVRNQETEEELERSKTRTRNMVQKNVELTQQIKEMEERPVTVAVAEQDQQELERLQAQVTAKDQELDRVRSEYEIRLQNAEAKQEMLPMEQTDTRPAFKAHLENAVDSMKRLANFIAAHRTNSNADMYRARTLEMLKRMEESIV